MTLPASGSISLSQVNTELGYSSSAQISLNNSAVRTLFGKSSGAIAMSDGYGKANQFAFTISSNQTNANLATLATAAGWNGTSKVVATINAGVYISSNSTGTPALTVSSLPNGAEIINNGYIVGMGGAGGNGGNGSWYPTAGVAGGGGGVALSVSSALSMTNNNTIAGGGGGGGGQGGSFNSNAYEEFWYGGAGGGGGRSSAAANSSAGSRGANNRTIYYYAAGTAGTVSAPGSAGASQLSSTATIRYSGGGGAWGSAGGTGGIGGAQYPQSGGAGGSGGGAVTGNSNITWVATGTRLGSIS